MPIGSKVNTAFGRIRRQTPPDAEEVAILSALTHTERVFVLPGPVSHRTGPGWPVGRLAGWPVGRLFGWWVGGLVGGLVGWWVGGSVGGSVGGLA